MSSYKPSHYSELTIDKAGLLRSETEILQKLAQKSDSIYVPFHKDLFLYQDNNNQEASAQLQAVSLRKDELDQLSININDDIIFLGISQQADMQSKPDPLQSQAYFAIDIDSEEDAAKITDKYSSTWGKLNELGKDLSQDQASLLAYASGHAYFNKRNKFMGLDGAPTVAWEGGHARKQKGDNKSVIYPRIDPAIIVLVNEGDYALLGQNARRPHNRFSILAGFVEIGETFEQAIVREVDEETGVEVDINSCQYLYSQPWPFPQSIMIGFVAKTKGFFKQVPLNEQFSPPGLERFKELQKEFKLEESEFNKLLQEAPYAPNPKDHEMAQVKWFHKDWLAKAIHKGPSGFVVPSTNSIAGQIIRQFNNGDLKKYIDNDFNEIDKGPQPPEWVDTFPEVDIDEGRFKYVLVRLLDTSNNYSRVVVRGYKGPQYTFHQDVLGSTDSKARNLGLQVQVLGGGRIEHYPEDQIIKVYGYSQGYGTGLHEVAANLLKKWYPLYDSRRIVYSYEGY